MSSSGGGEVIARVDGVASLLMAQLTSLLTSGIMLTVPTQVDQETVRHNQQYDMTQGVKEGATTNCQLDNSNGMIDLDSFQLSFLIEPKLGNDALNSADLLRVGGVSTNLITTGPSLESATDANQINYVSLFNPCALLERYDMSIGGVRVSKWEGAEIPYGLRASLDRVINKVDNGGIFQEYSEVDSVFWSPWNKKQMYIYKSNINGTNAFRVNIPLRDGIILRPQRVMASGKISFNFNWVRDVQNIFFRNPDATNGSATEVTLNLTEVSLLYSTISVISPLAQRLTSVTNLLPALGVKHYGFQVSLAATVNSGSFKTETSLGGAVRCIFTVATPKVNSATDATRLTTPFGYKWNSFTKFTEVQFEYGGQTLWRPFKGEIDYTTHDRGAVECYESFKKFVGGIDKRPDLDLSYANYIQNFASIYWWVDQQGREVFVAKNTPLKTATLRFATTQSATNVDFYVIYCFDLATKYSPDGRVITGSQLPTTKEDLQQIIRAAVAQNLVQQ